MRRRTRWLAVALGVAAVLALKGCPSGPPTAALPWPAVVLTPRDRILVLAPHPDDEVLGCGGIIQRALAMGLPVRMVFLTYGDNNEWSFLLSRRHPVLMPGALRRMGEVRHDEALFAAKALGVPPQHLTFLGYPDFGMLPIWKSHWGDRPAFRSMLTRVTSVPYANALRPGAPYKGEEILRDLTTILREVQPTKVFLSHPADSMPDHSALYLFTRVALWDLAGQVDAQLYPYLVHFPKWPSPRGFRPSSPLVPPAVLSDRVPWAVHRLPPEDVERKQRALRAHRTQMLASGKYLLSFVRRNELFGDFPAVMLRAGPAPTTLALDAAAGSPETSEELTDEERAAFVGLETRSVQLQGDALVCSIGFSRPLGAAVQASVFVFGYRRDRPFADMPKLHVRFGPILHEVYDQDRKLPAERIGFERRAKQVTLRIPLTLLGDPERILTSARTSLGDVPLDWASWRILELPHDHRAQTEPRGTP